MRIIAGQWRSRRLAYPPPTITRPMPDRAREAIFSSLGAHYETPGELPPLTVADIFAGSGSMGLEALSRGAARCVFFENDRRALSVLRSNIELLQAGDRATVVSRDAWLSAAQPQVRHPFDLVLLDPPYADSQDTTATGEVHRFLVNLAPHAATSALVVFHHHEKAVYNDDPTCLWRIMDQRHYGSSAITIWTH